MPSASVTPAGRSAASRPRRRPPRAGQGRLRGTWPLAAALGAGLLVAVIVGLLLGGGGGIQRPLLESIFQDDDHLLYSSTATVQQTLAELRSLGVDRIRVTVLWSALAPGALAAQPPPGFQASDPAAYPASAWYPYDRLVLLARARGIQVDFNPTAPGPLWAMARPAPSARLANHLRPDPQAFGSFVAAVGRRYDGSYVPRGAGGPLPRVSFWTIWNEPNQPGWLYPQWQSSAGTSVMQSPALYRSYVDAAFSGLRASSHSTERDQVLIGELAPEGSRGTSPSSAIPPLPFLRSLYCVDAAYRPLRGAAASAQQCPASGSADAFVSAHPGLFSPSGFAHHPYAFFLPPARSMSDPDFAPLADLGRLETTLDRALGAYGVDRRLPIYLTEYGYETNPPNPFRGVSLARQALYLDQAQYLAARDPRVRSMAQFLLYDSPPDTAYPAGSLRYWSTFQTGLRFASGADKPALQAYRMPIFVAHPAVPARGQLQVWGMLRPAPNHTRQAATIQWQRRGGAYVTLARVSTTDPSGILTATVSPPGSGSVRIAWTAPGGAVILSPSVPITVG